MIHRITSGQKSFIRREEYPIRAGAAYVGSLSGYACFFFRIRIPTAPSTCLLPSFFLREFNFSYSCAIWIQPSITVLALHYSLPIPSSLASINTGDYDCTTSTVPPPRVSLIHRGSRSNLAIPNLPSEPVLRDSPSIMKDRHDWRLIPQSLGVYIYIYKWTCSDRSNSCRIHRVPRDIYTRFDGVSKHRTRASHRRICVWISF